MNRHVQVESERQLKHFIDYENDLKIIYFVIQKIRAKEGEKIATRLQKNKEKKR